MAVVDCSKRVCVVGAGSSGLAVARQLKEQGFAVDILEREDDLGGNWNYGKPNARVYRSTHMITSKTCTQFPDFPMPSSFPDYPHHSQVLAYLRSYAEHFGLQPLIEYRTPVEKIVPHEDGRQWDVTISPSPSMGEGWDEGDGCHRAPTPHPNPPPQGGREKITRRYGALVIANGHNWSPKWPTYPGTFTGTKLHSAQYRTPDVLAGKRVLVVGGGNSGCDLAVESSQNAACTYHSTRRGYYYIPKYLFGRPSDKLGDKLHKIRAPLWLRRLLTTKVLRWVVGAPDKFGLAKPDHKLYETHPVHNSLLLYYVSHGDIVPKPEIHHFDNDTVHFVDGSSVSVDMIVFATGYNIVFPFIDKELLNWHDGRPRLYRNVFHPKYDNLFVCGLIQPDGGQFVIVHWQARALALFLKAQRDGDPAADRLRQLKGRTNEDLGHGINYADSTRHYLQIEHWGYRKGLQQLAEELTPRRAA